MPIFVENIHFKHFFNCSPERLFVTCSNPNLYGAWFVPDLESSIIIDWNNIYSGGTSRVHICRKNNLGLTIEKTYHIVEPNKLVMFTDFLWNGDFLQVIAVMEYTMTTNRTGCCLEVSGQITSFIGQEGILEYLANFKRTLSSLAILLLRCS